MEWSVDTRIGGAVWLAEEEIRAHLLRHASEPAMVDMARPLIQEALLSLPPGRTWLALDWEDQEGQLRARQLGDIEVRGASVGPGVVRAPGTAPPPSTEAEEMSLALRVSRMTERDIDPGPADPGLIPDDRPAHLLGLMAAEMADGHTLEEAAARAGATVAEREARRTPLEADAGRLAEILVEAEERLGADFEVMSSGPERAVIRNRRCPFGDTAPAMCRFTSALAGGLAARASGRGDVNVVESLAAGDHECRLVLELARPEPRSGAHRYRWPPPGEPASLSPPSNRGFQVTLSLQLPRDRLSVPVTRHLIRAALQEVGVVADDADAVELAVTEACANVIDHSGPGDAYEVAVAIGASSCHIRVVDIGRGFDHSALSIPSMASTDAEHGRGVALMHALVDQVRFESEPERGTVVHLVKKLHFDDSSTARRLMLEGTGAADTDSEGNP